VSAAFARALSRTGNTHTAARKRPSPETLLADFDYDPEI
jgi:hypothetical protein